MEQDAVFLADDHIDTVRRRALSRDRTGKNTMIAGRGGIDSDATITIDEGAPLLGQMSNEGSEGQGNGDEASQWIDESHWDLLPWYKRPSVNAPHQVYIRSEVLINIRHIGF